VTSSGTNTVVRFATARATSGDLGVTGSTVFANDPALAGPFGLRFLSDGHLYVVAARAGTLLKLDLRPEACLAHGTQSDLYRQLESAMGGLDEYWSREYLSLGAWRGDRPARPLNDLFPEG
jgi:hypothetical protein